MLHLIPDCLTSISAVIAAADVAAFEWQLAQLSTIGRPDCEQPSTCPGAPSLRPGRRRRWFVHTGCNGKHRRPDPPIFARSSSVSALDPEHRPPMPPAWRSRCAGLPTSVHPDGEPVLRMHIAHLRTLTAECQLGLTPAGRVAAHRFVVFAFITKNNKRPPEYGLQSLATNF